MTSTNNEQLSKDQSALSLNLPVIMVLGLQYTPVAISSCHTARLASRSRAFSPRSAINVALAHHIEQSSIAAICEHCAGIVHAC